MSIWYWVKFYVKLSIHEKNVETENTINSYKSFILHNVNQFSFMFFPIFFVLFQVLPEIEDGKLHTPRNAVHERQAKDKFFQLIRMTTCVHDRFQHLPRAQLSDGALLGLMVAGMVKVFVVSALQ